EIASEQGRPHPVQVLIEPGDERPRVAFRPLAAQGLVHGQPQVLALDDPFKQVVGPPHPCLCLPGPTGCGGPPASARRTSRSARPRRPRPAPAPPWSRPAPAPSVPVVR